jgi:23S rRNA (adenine2503-C2)-methyltransferase
MLDTRQHILSLTPDELTAELAKLKMPKFRTKQIHEWIFEKRATSFDEMTNLGLADRMMLAETFVIFRGEPAREQRSPDGTEKILLRWPDGGTTETVMIPSDDDQCDEFGNTTVAHRRTACVSTQVGCPVKCAFCASGLEGLKSQLDVGQIVEQVLRLTHALPKERRITNVVFMGMGEPLANFDVTVAAIRVLMAPWAFHISGRKITLSTVGLPPQMKRFADLAVEGMPVTLAISLHAPNDELRARIIPWAEKISIEQLVEAGKYYFDKTGREVTFEYIVLDGVNNLTEHARQLAKLAKQLRANVNLIYYNEVPELPFKRPSGNAMHAFQNALKAAGVNAHIRKSRGREIAAACGQLARQDQAEREKAVQVGIPTK